MLIQGTVCRASHAFKSSLFFLLSSYTTLLDSGHTVEIFGFAFWVTIEMKLIPAGIPRTVEAGEFLGDGVLQPTSSGRTTAQGDTKQRQENSRKCTANASET